MIFLRNSSPVIGDENMPNVPSVAPLWPSADVVAQQSVRVIVLKPARMCVAAMACGLDAAYGSYWYSIRTRAVLLVSNSQPPLAFAGLNTRADLEDERPAQRQYFVTA